MLGRKRLEEWQAMRKRDDTRKNEIMHMLETQQAEYGNVRRPAEANQPFTLTCPLAAALCLRVLIPRRALCTAHRDEMEAVEQEQMRLQALVEQHHQLRQDRQALRELHASHGYARVTDVADALGVAPAAGSPRFAASASWAKCKA